MPRGVCLCVCGGGGGGSVDNSCILKYRELNVQSPPTTCREVPLDIMISNIALSNFIIHWIRSALNIGSRARANTAVTQYKQSICKYGLCRLSNGNAHVYYSGTVCRPVCLSASFPPPPPPHTHTPLPLSPPPKELAISF